MSFVRTLPTTNVCFGSLADIPQCNHYDQRVGASGPTSTARRFNAQNPTRLFLRNWLAHGARINSWRFPTATKDRLRGRLVAPIIQIGLTLGSLHGNLSKNQKACPRSSKPFHSYCRFLAGRLNDVLHEHGE